MKSIETYCFFSAQYLPTLGGVERYTFNMAKELIRRGHRVIVVTSLLKEQQEEQSNLAGITVLRTPAFSMLNGRMPISFPSSHWKNICRKLDELAVTRVVIQTRLYTLSLMGMRYAQKRDIPFITIEHGTSYVGMSNALLRFAEKCYENILMHLAKKRCSSFFAVSKAGTQWLQNFNIQAKGVLYNSVDEQMVLHNVQENVLGDLRARFLLPTDAIVISFVGRLIPEKGIQQLVRAVSRLQDKKFYLFVAGDGPLYASLKKGAVPNVIFLGSISQKEVASLLSQSTLFCLPSDSEGFPTSVLEAVLCHCYVISTPFGGTKELISSHKYGKIISNNSEDEIYSAILKSVQDIASCRKCAENAYCRFFEGFTWRHTCDTLERHAWGK